MFKEIRDKAPKTTEQYFYEAGSAGREFFLELAYSLRIDKLCDWLLKVLKKVSRDV
jgi:hypothetical protein